MDDTLVKLFVEPFLDLWVRVQEFVSHVYVAVVVLAAGFIAAAIARRLSHAILRAVGFDSLSSRLGISEAAERGGLRGTPSALAADIIKWGVLVIFAAASLMALELPASERLFERFVLYVPSVLAAGLILLAGYLLSGFLSRAVLIGSVNAGLRAARLIARMVRFAVMALTATMAMEQLGIAKDTIIVAFAIAFGGVVLALALAFGLGGSELARQYLSETAKDKAETDGIDHL